MFLLLGLLFLATPSLAQVATGVPEGALPSDPAAPEQPAESYECDPDSCQLPSCHCASTEPPGGLSPSDTPQFITWTSDDAMNIYTDAAVKGFLEERRNPNDCPVRSTYYVSTMSHNYSLATDFYVSSNEVGCHTVNHNEDSASDENEILANIAIQNRWSGIPASAIKGFRAPFLNLTLETFRILADNGFDYDSSLTTSLPPDSDSTDSFWPYTLDNGLAHGCAELAGTCPGDLQLPGLWEIPMYSIFEGDRAVSVMDPWLTGGTEATLDLMKENFEAHYNGNRQPFGLYTHPAHLISNYPGVTAPIDTIDMIVEFLDWVQDHDDVWFVSNEQLLEWMRDPVAVSELAGTSYMQCQVPDVEADICNGMSPNQDGLLVPCAFDVLTWGASSCYGCPEMVPNITDASPEQVPSSDGSDARVPVPEDCGTAWWDPIEGRCLCEGDSCAFKDEGVSYEGPSSDGGTWAPQSRFDVLLSTVFIALSLECVFG